MTAPLSCVHPARPSRSRRLAALLLGGLLGVLLLVWQPAPARAAAGEAPVDPATLARAVDQMEQLDRLRISLASTLEGSSEEPTLDTMRQVCRPVGQRAVAIGRENGWTVRQVASRYRNPDHAPAGAQETGVIDLFSRHPEVTGLWEPATADQGAGVNYYRRIDVQASCLACHGSRESRPAFVKERYADDRAFDFKPGDLRGMYAVFIPELQEALQQAG
ncbi:DUF3365 domain-containing protein [Cyanobium sp. CH-040]|uniref:Tll0287-like domain-containing protein n=1 Tax=Cyanobium sp. CH-040 TaxID=2823708 RepID=UPI0020CBA623|nr:DUF3365 domain-containing protein [Cyanobium sp. CH-040]MCP9927086.1 DUF3365 domain-containing protein [Cyanobium sp. CH-040]